MTHGVPAFAAPEAALAIFHGHPDVPRLFHYFPPHLMAQGKAVLCLDGDDRFDPLLIARWARRPWSEIRQLRNLLPQK